MGSLSAPFPGHPGELDAVAMGCRHTTQPVLGSLGCYCEATHWLASAADTCLPQFWMLWSEMRVLGASPGLCPHTAFLVARMRRGQEPALPCLLTRALVPRGGLYPVT